MKLASEEGLRRLWLDDYVHEISFGRSDDADGLGSEERGSFFPEKNWSERWEIFECSFFFKEILAWSFVFRVLVYGGDLEVVEKSRGGSAHRAMVADDGEWCERHVYEWEG